MKRVCILLKCFPKVDYMLRLWHQGT